MLESHFCIINSPDISSPCHKYRSHVPWLPARSSEMKTMQKPNQEFAIRGQKKPKCIIDLVPFYVSKLSCQEDKCHI